MVCVNYQNLSKSRKRAMLLTFLCQYNNFVKVKLQIYTTTGSSEGQLVIDDLLTGLTSKVVIGDLTCRNWTAPSRTPTE